MLTAGPGVTNGVSGITSAFFNAAPVLVLGGRAPQFRWGSGSLQEMDHVPIVASITKHASTILATDDVPSAVAAALTAALTPHRGPAFLDLPLEVIYGSGEAAIPTPDIPMIEPDPVDVAKAAALIAAAQQPVIIAGSDVYAGDAVAELREAAEAMVVPVFANGMGRGALPPDHRLAFAKARRAALGSADVVVVIGTPLDFRLSLRRLRRCAGHPHRRRAVAARVAPHAGLLAGR